MDVTPMRAEVARNSLSASWPLLLAGAVFASLLAVGVWGWATYGAAIFFDMIVSGIASCF
jgi:hypothetical protein